MSKRALTHVDASGKASMVDVGGKTATKRRARVGVSVWMAPETLRLLQEQALPKGDVLAVAKVAGIMAAKRTPELVPLCHLSDRSGRDLCGGGGRELIDIE